MREIRQSGSGGGAGSNFPAPTSSKENAPGAFTAPGALLGLAAGGSSSTDSAGGTPARPTGETPVLRRIAIYGTRIDTFAG